LIELYSYAFFQPVLLVEIASTSQQPTAIRHQIKIGTDAKVPWLLKQVGYAACSKK
jgi:hypothetical protein